MLQDFKIEDWSSWLYSLVSKLQLCNVSIDMLRKSVRNSYIKLIQKIRYFLPFIFYFHWYYCFKVILLLSLYGFLSLGGHFEERKVDVILLSACGETRQRGHQPYLHLLENLNWFVSFKKHSVKSLMDSCRFEEISKLLKQ